MPTNAIKTGTSGPVNKNINPTTQLTGMTTIIMIIGNTPTIIC